MTQNVEVVDKIFQELIVNCDKKHRGAYGGRGSGKSWSLARIILTMAMEKPLFVVCVREVQKSIALSVKKLLDDTINALGWNWFYTTTKECIKGSNGTLIVFYGLHDHNADNIKSLEGADICWVAEAQSISRQSIDILRPTIRKKDAIFFWDFNPRYSSDPVYVDYIRNKDPNAKFVNVNWNDNPWFNDSSLPSEKEADYARDLYRAQHIWEGKLMDEHDMFVCPADLVEQAQRNVIVKNPPGIVWVGADIAHQGGDEIVFYKRINDKVIDQYISRYQNAIETKNDLKLFAGTNSIINIDNGHIGAAVADLLESDGLTVNRINFGGTPYDKEHYEDVATEMYFNLKDRLPSLCIPNDEELAIQLYTRKYLFINGKRGYEVMKIEDKKTFAEHTHALHKSPDRGDALALAFYDVGAPVEHINIVSNIFAYGIRSN